MPGLVTQACSGSPAQLWAGTGTSPDLIWNEYYDTTYHTRCPWGSGYTQSVITADSAGGVVTLACPESTSGYTANQKWALNTVTAPAAPVGQAPAQLALPMGTCSQAGSQGCS
jgi:hypothetical protein